MEFNPNLMSFNNNSIKNYNKFLNTQMDAVGINFNSQGMMDFDNTLNNAMNQRNSIPQGPIVNTGIQMNVGLENMGISPIERIEPSQHSNTYTNKEPKSAVEKTADQIGKAFGNGLDSVNRAQNEAYDAAEIFAAGGDISVHDVMIASQKANLTMNMAIQLRNRLINAYTEINNVRV